MRSAFEAVQYQHQRNNANVPKEDIVLVLRAAAGGCDGARRGNTDSEQWQQLRDNILVTVRILGTSGP
jgi:hypothetical protein